MNDELLSTDFVYLTEKPAFLVKMIAEVFTDNGIPYNVFTHEYPSRINQNTTVKVFVPSSCKWEAKALLKELFPEDPEV